MPIETPPCGWETETDGSGCAAAKPLARAALVGDEGALCDGVAEEDAGMLRLAALSSDDNFAGLDAWLAVEMADANWSARKAVSSRLRYAAYTANCTM